MTAEPRVFLSSDFFLFKRQEQAFLSHHHGAVPPIPVTEMDMMLLSLCSFGDTKAISESFLAHPWVQTLPRKPESIAIEQRIHYYQKLGVITEEGAFAKQPDQQLEWEQATTELPDLFCVGRNVVIGFKGQDFYAWSERRQKNIILTLQQAVILMRLPESSSIQDCFNHKALKLIDKASLQNDIKALLTVGLLVESSSIHLKATESLPAFYNEKPSPERKTWRTTNKLTKIPVYFVPHMENHFPLALGMLYSAMEHAQQAGKLSDYQLIPIEFLEPQAFLDGPYKKFGCGVWLFSNYMWSAELNLKLSDFIKQQDPHNLTIHGGPSTPNYPEAGQRFMEQHQSVDICVHGEGEAAIIELLEGLETSPQQQSVSINPFQLSAVTGLTFRNPLTRQLQRTGARARMKQPDVVPSPYLTGVFDYYGGRVEAAIVETNRGCPYRCTFCDWGSATNQKISTFDLQRVYDEINWIGSNRIKVMWIADANFGMFERDIEIAKCIVATKRQYGFPKEIVVNYTKNANKKLVEIVRILTEGDIISQGIISIQTTDEKTLEVIDRKNIRTDRYDELAALFRELKLPLSTDLMLGLPGITVNAFKQDLQKYIDMDVTVKAYPTQLLPNSPMADPAYIEKYKIKVDASNYLIATSSYTEQELLKMKALFELYTMFEGYGLLRYLMRFLQWEHGIPATDFLEKIYQLAQTKYQSYPTVSWVCRYFNTYKTIPFGWKHFYEEIKTIVLVEYNIADSSELECVLAVNRAVMPDDAYSYPRKIMLPHDIIAYMLNFQQNQTLLRDYAGAEFEISDPNGLVGIDTNLLQYDNHQYFWELHSSLSRAQSIADFSQA